MYAASLGATPRCLTRAQHDEAANLCACLRSRGPVTVGALGAGDAYSTIDFSAGDSGPCSLVPTIPMPPDFDPRDPCEAAGRPVCAPQLERPTFTSTYSPADYEEKIASGAMLTQRIVVFGVLGLVLAGGGYLVYRTVKKG